MSLPTLHCRFCDQPLEHTVIDLGTAPLSNAYLSAEGLRGPELHFPLRVYFCTECYLVQLPASAAPDQIFSDDYAYFSSYSTTWLRHSKAYVDHMRAEYGIGADDYVVEVGSNDGYLLRYFLDAGVPVQGIDPAQNVADAAEAIGVPTLSDFFGADLARSLTASGRKADLLIGNNVLAHVPDLNDFVEGLRIMLAPGGVLTMEFPHLLRMIQNGEFDTIYHEHFSYFSLLAVENVFAAHGLTVFDVEELPTHGGSLRIYARHHDDARRPVSPRVTALHRRELDEGLTDPARFRSFQDRAATVRHHLLDFLLTAHERGKTVVGYGAPAKGNTLLNYCGVRSDLLAYTVDCNPCKQGHFLPGSRIPVYAPERIFETKPDYVLILPWNLTSEIVDQMREVTSWGGTFLVAIPDVTLIDPSTGDGAWRESAVEHHPPTPSHAG